MIAPLAPFAIRGAIWYQGEANVGRPQEYGKLLPLLIENWRDSFLDTTMSFYYVQIAPYVYDTLSQSQLLRESQAKTLSVAHTGMAVTLDIGNFTNIHPTNKPEVGRRLALCALAKTYGRRVAYSGPVLLSVKQGTTRMVLTFAHAKRGLVIRPTQRGSGFEIAGADRVFKNADVRVQDSTLIVSNPTIEHPQSVRYGFSNTPDATFFNGAGLPSTSFRTDDW
jgi:sialate O-acetylesterase